MAVALAGATLVALLAVPLGLNLGGLRDRLLGTATAPRIDPLLCCRLKIFPVTRNRTTLRME